MQSLLKSPLQYTTFCLNDQCDDAAFTTLDLLLTIIVPQHIIETLLSNLVAKETLS